MSINGPFPTTFEITLLTKINTYFTRNTYKYMLTFDDIFLVDFMVVEISP